MDEKAIRAICTCPGSREGDRSPYGLSVAECSGDRSSLVGPAYYSGLSDLRLSRWRTGPPRLR
eukprot:7182362-Lingulodinium_polyedra.AAC.1